MQVGVFLGRQQVLVGVRPENLGAGTKVLRAQTLSTESDMSDTTLKPSRNLRGTGRV